MLLREIHINHCENNHELMPGGSNGSGAQNTISFGTCGWRAVIGDGFTKHNVQIAVRAIAQIMKDTGTNEKGFVIGYGGHPMSWEAAKWAAEVVAGQGIFCRVIKGVVPASLVMCTVKKLNLEFGMAVTAGHNSEIYNGIKVFTRGGMDAGEAVTYKIEMYIKEYESDPVGIMKYDEGVKQGLIEEIDPFDDYIESMISFICTERISQRKPEVILECLHNTEGISMEKALTAIGCNVSVVHSGGLSMGRIPAAKEKSKSSFRNHLRGKDFDLGILIHGDSDHIEVFDEKEQLIYPNLILALLYFYLLNYKGWKGPCVRNSCTARLLDRVAESFNEKCYEVPVGFKYVSAKMAQTNAVIGGESSCGLAVRGHISGRDGIFEAVLLAEMVAITEKSLSELEEEIFRKYGPYYCDEFDFPIAAEARKQIQQKLFIDKLLPDFPFEVAKVSYLDGCQVYFRNGGVAAVRFSGTEPVLRIHCEMNSSEDTDLTIKVILDFLSLKR
jgi:Phosphomannomutase